jgi:hypothetical protein
MMSIMGPTSIQVLSLLVLTTSSLQRDSVTLLMENGS